VVRGVVVAVVVLVFVALTQGADRFVCSSTTL